MRYTECDANGFYREYPEELGVEINISNNESVLVKQESLGKPANQTQIVYKIPRYSLEPSYKYEVSIKATLRRSSSVWTTSSIQILVEQSPLLVYIQDGNRQSGYEQSLKLQGVARDLDVREGQ